MLHHCYFRTLNVLLLQSSPLSSSLLKEGEFFSNNGYPKMPFPHGWKGNAGLYVVGFTKKGLSGASSDAVRIAQDIGRVWKQETKQKKQRTTACHRRCISQF